MIQLIKPISGLFIVGVILFSACKSSETNPTDRVSIGLHQSARLGSDVVVRVDSIQDSRCPVNVYCVWQGVAKAKLRLSKDSDSSIVRLMLGAYPANKPKRADSTGVTLHNQLYKVILREVNPYPGTSANGQPQTAIVQVTKI